MKARVCVTTMGKRESPTFGGRGIDSGSFFFFFSEEDLLFLYSQLCTYSSCKFRFGPVIFIPTLFYSIWVTQIYFYL